MFTLVWAAGISNERSQDRIAAKLTNVNWRAIYGLASGARLLMVVPAVRAPWAVMRIGPQSMAPALEGENMLTAIAIKVLCIRHGLRFSECVGDGRSEREEVIDLLTTASREEDGPALINLRRERTCASWSFGLAAELLLAPGVSFATAMHEFLVAACSHPDEEWSAMSRLRAAAWLSGLGSREEQRAELIRIALAEMRPDGS